MERQSDQNLGREAEPEGNRQEHGEAGENLQGRRRIDFIGIVSIETAERRVFLSLRTHSNL
jgi:hypothetical protein